MNNYTVAVLVPCYNEEAAIADVVSGFRQALPDADIYVFDNNSTDKTVETARRAGAIIRHEHRQGKGHVVQKMFASVEADIYVLVDGDATYHAPSCPEMIAKLLDEDLDMVVGKRIHSKASAYRKGHVLGNMLFTRTIQRLFGNSISDLLSGYRVFSRRFVKSYPCFTKGFEIETDMTVHALHLNLPVAEVETPYHPRPENSSSKLNTYRDGLKILYKILSLFLYEKPKIFMGLVSAFLLLLAITLAIPLIATWLETGLVPRFPTAILCSSLVILALGGFAMGFMLEAVQKTRKAATYLAYLAQRGNPGR